MPFTGPRLLVALTLAIGVMCAVIVVATSTSTQAAHLVVRWTGRTSVVLFLLAYVARPATQLRPRTFKKLLAQRKWLGLGFASSHTFHLAGLVALAAPAPAAFVRGQQPTIIVAVVTYLVVYAMALTSIDRVRKSMPPRWWKRLHRTGMHLAWLVFATTYVGAATTAPTFVVPAAAVLAAAAIRLVAYRRGKRQEIAVRAATHG